MLTGRNVFLQPGFPNVFHVIGPNAIAGTWGWTIGNQTTVIARLIKDVSLRRSAADLFMTCTLVLMRATLQMAAYGIGALQPKQEAFELENEAHQAKLGNSVRAAHQTNAVEAPY